MISLGVKITVEFILILSMANVRLIFSKHVIKIVGGYVRGE